MHNMQKERARKRFMYWADTCTNTCSHNGLTECSSLNADRLAVALHQRTEPEERKKASKERKKSSYCHTQQKQKHHDQALNTCANSSPHFTSQHFSSLCFRCSNVIRIDAKASKRCFLAGWLSLQIENQTIRLSIIAEKTAQHRSLKLRFKKRRATEKSTHRRNVQRDSKIKYTVLGKETNEEKKRKRKTTKKPKSIGVERTISRFAVVQISKIANCLIEN